ncbi:MAG: formate dehydrogenase subunit alpha [Chloroflexi bacterium RBG_13_52_12]|nr:MAG: formate dehydrogenase subunit alpha [Chloroflexi bacterium RBG_13_52_12]
MEAITIVLNGVEVSGNPGTTILDLARESGVYIPTLCHDPNLTSTGACRLCLVEDERNGALLASCVAPIGAGMTINTNSPRVLEHRKKILKLMLASHPDTCLVCNKGNRCQLRKLASEMGIGLVEYQKIPQLDVIEEVNPFIERDLSKCILCGKCIRADHELVVEGAIDYMNRGTQAKPATLNDVPLEKAECTFCGTCVNVCPTGAIMEKERAYTGTATKVVTTVCPYCGCGCSIALGIKDGKVVNAMPAPDSPVNRGTLCVRGSYGYDFVHSPERLRTPLIKVDGELREATWEEALSLVAGEFRRIKKEHGADALAVFGSTRCTNEENYLLQRFSRGVLGTNNIDNGSRLYSAASRIGLGASIGYAGTTGSIDTLEKSKAIMVIGANPEISAPAVAYAIKRAARYKGAELCVIDPRWTHLAPFASLWLQLKVGTDVALLNGLAKVIIDEKKYDVEFVTRMTDNFTQWAKSLDKYTPAYVETVTGIPKNEIQTAARMLSEAEEASIVYGNGVTQHATGTDAVIAIANLAMLTGNTGRRGGIFALQRENNAHGACDMGALPGFLPGYKNIDNAQNRKKYEERWGRQIPGNTGLTAVEMMEAALEGKVKGMFISGENVIAGFPRPARVEKALSNLEFLVVADMFLTETARLATVILPAASFAEKEGTFTNFEGRVQRLHKAIEPCGESLPDSEIVMRIAAKLESPMPFTSSQQVMEEIEEMVPFYHHLAYRDADSLEADLDDTDINTPRNRRLFNGLFPSGFGRFSAVEYTPPTDVATEKYPFTLLVGSVLFNFGSGSRSSRSKRLKRFRPGAFLEINDGDAKNLGIKDGSKVRVTSAQGELTTTVKIDARLQPGLLFMPLSFSETPVYELFDTTLYHQAKAPALKSCAVKLERIGDDG